MSRLLDYDLLGHLHDAWTRQRAPIAGALRPGLSSEEIHERGRSLGLEIPREAQEWWGWHDGARLDAAPSQRFFGPRHEFLTLSEAVERCQFCRDVALEVSGTQEASDWRWSWLPITRDKHPLVLECAGGDNEPVPARSFSFEEPDAASEGAASFGELVTVWLEAMECGAWRYDESSGFWDYDWEKLDPVTELRRLT